MLKISLSQSELQELKSIRFRSGDERSEKALIIILLNEGLSVTEISKRLKRNKHTIRKWIKRYQEHNIQGLDRKFSKGAPAIKRTKLKNYLQVIMSESPSNYGYQANCWTIPLIMDYYKKKENAEASEDTVQRALRDLGYSYKKPKKTVPVKAPTKKEKKDRVLDMIRDIKKFVEEDRANIYFLDETHFSTQPYTVKGWFKKRCSSIDINSSQKRELYNFWCVEYKGKKAYLEEFPKK